MSLLRSMRKAGLLLTLMIGMIACGAHDHTLLKVQRLDPVMPVGLSGGLEAGLARVDITPPPGISVAGYSAMAERCLGFRNRLYARAVYLRSAEGQVVALVQCDLLSGSLLLHHRVAELIARQTDVPINGLMIAGTHTHSAPGNYFGSNFYNTFASSAKGLDLDLYRFLSERIAAAVVEAYQHKRPARMAVGTTDIRGVTRNRSLAAFLANFPAASDPDAVPEMIETVNPVMTMIRIDLADDNGLFRPAGAFSSFSVHPTAVPHWNFLYTADVFGYIARELEFELAREEDTPWPKVHAAVNGTHGDNSPAYTPGQQGFIEARRLGVEIGRQAVALFHSLKNNLQADVSVASACREVDLYRDGTINDVSICPRPVVGNALTAGADDGKTPVLYRLPFFREGWSSARWLFTGSCQGHKRHVGGIFQPLVLKKTDFPHHLFVQVIRVGETLLLPFPFELTCQAGRRVSEAVAREADEGLEAIVVISCANGYFGYCTTPEEYSRQHYEGGHTLYGPNTAPFLTQQAVSLVSALNRRKLRDLPDNWDFELKTASYFPEARASLGQRTEAEKPVFLKAGKNVEACWVYRWWDVGPDIIDFHRPLVQVQASLDGSTWQGLVLSGREVDDEGYDLSIRFLKKIDNQHMGLYEARWYNPEIPDGAACRFAIMPREGQETFFSSAFR